MATSFCTHEEFEANVSVNRLTDDNEITRFVVDVTVRCAECEKIFGFRVPDVGLLPDRPTVSPDGKELRVPLISPSELELITND